MIRFRQLLVIIGLLPSLLFFVWVERNATLPYLPIALGWPWIEGESWSLPFRLVWDCALFGVFAALHSALATFGWKKRVSLKLGSEKWNRPIYVAISGLSLLGVMGLWQNTGVLIWVFPEFLGLGLLPFGFHLFSLLYLSILLVALRVLSRLDLGVFAGFTQDARNENQTSGAEPSSSTALASGAFSWVRHPIYSLTLLAFFLTPLMSLDRILITVVTLIYLLGWGIPLEEKKLIQEFGESYRKYQKQVPALIPSIQRLKAALSRR